MTYCFQGFYSQIVLDGTFVLGLKVADVNDAIYANAIITLCDNFSFSGLLANIIKAQVKQEVEGTVKGDKLNDLNAAIFQPVV